MCMHMILKLRGIRFKSLCYNSQARKKSYRNTDLHLYARGEDILIDNIQLNLNKQNKYGFTPLMCAALSGNLSTYKELLNFKPNLYLRDKQGNTIYHMAAVKGFEFLNLLPINSYIYSKNNSGVSPIEAIFLSKNKETDLNPNSSDDFKTFIYIKYQESMNSNLSSNLNLNLVQEEVENKSNEYYLALALAKNKLKLASKMLHSCVYFDFSNIFLLTSVFFPFNAEKLVIIKENGYYLDKLHPVIYNHLISMGVFKEYFDIFPSYYPLNCLDFKNDIFYLSYSLSSLFHTRDDIFRKYEGSMRNDFLNSFLLYSAFFRACAEGSEESVIIFTKYVDVNYSGSHALVQAAKNPNKVLDILLRCGINLDQPLILPTLCVDLVPLYRIKFLLHLGLKVDLDQIKEMLNVEIHRIDIYDLICLILDNKEFLNIDNVRKLLIDENVLPKYKLIISRYVELKIRSRDQELRKQESKFESECQIPKCQK